MKFEKIFVGLFGLGVGFVLSGIMMMVMSQSILKELNLDVNKSTLVINDIKIEEADSKNHLKIDEINDSDNNSKKNNVSQEKLNTPTFSEFSTDEMQDDNIREVKDEIVSEESDNLIVEDLDNSIDEVQEKNIIEVKDENISEDIIYYQNLVGTNEVEVQIYIPPNSNSDTICDILVKANVIDNQDAFHTYVKLEKKTKLLQKGQITFSPKLTYKEILENLLN